MQNQRKSMKKTCLKTSAFLTSIFFDFSSILAPKLKPRKQIPRSFFWILGPRDAQEAPRAPQEAPRGLQEGILKDFGFTFWEAFDIIFGTMNRYFWASGLAYVLVRGLLYFHHLLGLGGLFLGSCRAAHERFPFAAARKCSMGLCNGRPE